MPYYRPMRTDPSRGGSLSRFAAEVMDTIRHIPRGRVASYGQVAWLAGHPGGARQVAWILHSCSDRHRLPWQRVIGAGGRISLPSGRGLEEQRRRLRAEGVPVDPRGRVDLRKYQWEPAQGRRSFLFLLREAPVRRNVRGKRGKTRGRLGRPRRSGRT
jgi:methylated-DNA-protein-cysteine methyltransferase-like protein